MARLSDYDYDLPESSIAQEPLADRSASRLLYLHKDTGYVEHRTFRHVVDLLDPGDLLVVNDTRVTAFRLFGRKLTGASVEILALRMAEAPNLYECLVKPGKRLKPGTEIRFEDGLVGKIEQDLGEGKMLVGFYMVDIVKALTEQGVVPLPPYIQTRLADPERYQTVYARRPGSAAAPTAGLHFTPEIIESLRDKGVRFARVTLDVGIDTFRPVQTEDPSQHPIHGEECELAESTAEAIEKCEGRIIAVGTTSVRTLESFAVGPRKVAAGRKATKLFILPGYKFRIVDGMFTNFHMPRTSMLMMISALAGREAVMEAYRNALESGYRFLSFGDSMLIA